jgi:outer membrane protein assembly factor BamB
MAFADGRLFVPWLDFGARASASGLSGGFASNFKSGRGGLTAVDAATGKVLWQHKLPSMDFGAATVANDVVFTSTYAGVVYAYDTQTGKTLWSTQAPAGVNSFPAIDGDTLLIGAAAPGFSRTRTSSWSLRAPVIEPSTRKEVCHEKLTISSLSALAAVAVTSLTLTSVSSARSDRQASSTATTIQVKGGEFFFRLSKKSIAKPGKVTFVFKNVGHVMHDFKISGKRTSLISPGRTAGSSSRSRRRASSPASARCPGMPLQA